MVIFEKDKVYCGDALTILRDFPDQCVDLIITSPPYFKQRNYNANKQIGQEKELKGYVNNLVAVFSGCKRVLSDRGTLWLNLGDKYMENQLVGAPWNVALALKENGWLLRSDVIWHKPNAVPSSVENRPTVDHEYLFMFSKTKDYYYDADAIREPHITFTPKSKMRGGRKHLGVRGGTPENGKYGGNHNLHDGRWDQAFHPRGRNKRTVWSVPLSKFREAHFSVFPEKLIEPCVLVGSKEGMVVLDPFLGSGTTAVVAIKNGRHYVGIDIKKEYCEMARKRIKETKLGYATKNVG